MRGVRWTFKLTNMKYVIEQYPKNKDFDFSKMSIDQKALRLNAVKKTYKYGKEIKCKYCGKKHATEEYYIKDKETGRRATRCRDCQMKQAGVIEIGKLRFAVKIADKGFRRCCVCKEIKPLTEYKKNKGQYLGISNNCYYCANKLHSEFVKKQQQTIGTSYIKEFGKLKGITEFNEDILNDLKNEILENKAERERLKYFLDGKSFTTLDAFALYVEQKYGVNPSTVIYRINAGYKEKDCIISENEARSKAYTKGQIKVTDCKTGEMFIFKNTRDKNLLKMFSSTTITEYLKTGETVIRKREQKKGQSKYRIDCKIERI